MKKLTLIALLIITCVLFCACEKEEKEQNNSTHTIPPTQAVIVEPEWAEVDCDMILANPETMETVLYAEDFETFAVIGTTDEDSYIKIKVTEEATQMIKTLGELPSLQLIVNGDTFADITIDPATFNGEIVFGEDIPYDVLCQRASYIRGLF